MKNKQLKLYQKYKYNSYPNRELIYIGIDILNDYWFFYKCEGFFINVNSLNDYGLNTKQIIKDLNLKTYINDNGDEYIKGYSWRYFIEENLINFKPLLKDKLKNIINR